MRMGTELSLMRLMQLVSPGLPIGMYSYSQGLERAVDDGWVTSAEDTQIWLQGILTQSLTHIDLPILARLYVAWTRGADDEVSYWTQQLLAYRETAELRTEDRQTGQALARLLEGLGDANMQPWVRAPNTTLATMFSYTAVQWQIAQQQTLLGYAWGWLENQILCAVKLVPLGQVAGQRLLYELAGSLPCIVEEALSLQDAELGGSTFSLALASSRHEMQYSRLFRS